MDPETFQEVSEANFIPADCSVGFFTPTFVATSSERILFDTGINADGLLQAMQDAGLTPADVTHVVLTHMHPDHVGGLIDDAGNPTFPDVAYVVGQVEFDHWAAQNDETFEAKVRPFAEGITLTNPGDEVAPGVTAVEAYGHTPGHMAFQLDGGDARMMLTADTANHYVWSLQHPDWEVRFDADKAQAAETRRRLLNQIADERMAMLGYHLPFPAMAYVQRDGEGFRWVPHSHQLIG